MMKIIRLLFFRVEKDDTTVNNLRRELDGEVTRRVIAANNEAQKSRALASVVEGLRAEVRSQAQ